MIEGEGLRDVADGLGLLLSTQSFAARALIGSLCAAVMAAAAVRFGLVRTPRVRRGLVLAPIGTAAAAAAASAGDTFLPPLLVATSGVGEPFEVFGEAYTVHRLEWLVIAYVAVASFLLLRRMVGMLSARAYTRRAVTCTDPTVLAVVRRVSSKLGLGAPPVLLVEDCPGGAFTTGLRTPVVCLDPDLLDSLDCRELEGLLAHELAHISRRDVATNLVVGTIRDLTFFVPPLHLAARWLRQEQEHAADDLASAATRRPAALASSILKVWEARGTRSAVRNPAAMACATMVPLPGRLVTPGADGLVQRRLAGRPARDGGLRGGAKLIAARVVRLIEAQTPTSAIRERGEMAVFCAVLCALTAVTVVLPTQLGEQSLMVGQWSRPARGPVESPAMSTFRAITAPDAALPSAASATAVADRPAPQTVAGTPCASCLIPESAGQWRRGVLPAAPARTAGWRDDGGFIWEDADPALSATRSAEPLWGVDSPSGRVGVFVVR